MSINNLYTLGQPDPNRDACDSIPVSGSIIAVANMPDKCSLQPATYEIATTGQIDTTMTEATLSVSTVDGVAATADDSVVLTKGSVLYFGPAGSPYTATVVIAQTTTVTDAGVVVPIDPPSATVLGTDVAVTWGLMRLPSWQDLSINDTDTTADSTEGESFYEAQSTMSKAINVPLNYKVRDDDLAHKAVLYPASNESYRNIFVSILRNGFPVQCGPVKVLNRQRAGAFKTQTMMNVTLSHQSSIYLPGYRDLMTAASPEAELYDQVLRYSGFAVA